MLKVINDHHPLISFFVYVIGSELWLVLFTRIKTNIKPFQDEEI